TDRLPVISVTSDNLHDGVWDAVISNTSQGENRSPQLSWSPVSGAAGYAVCMVDESAGDWLHWKQTGITTPGLAQGAASASQYIGPYPPAGTHTYTVYVFALQDTDTDFRGSLDSNSMDFYAIVQKLDLTEGDKTGNVLACGKLSGQFSHVEEMQ
ncbi:MAG: phosphatidylethanolamine-binding protein, partial [Oscillospiraceae bacterium]|nr:phosphatidylethanolamine-binding protein [Oscillospiraceae bacterium]